MTYSLKQTETASRPLHLKHKIIKATFTGSENLREALGFVRGRQYTLMVEHNTRADGLIRISNMEHSWQECEYESLLAFLSNWDKIEVKK